MSLIQGRDRAGCRAKGRCSLCCEAWTAFERRVCSVSESCLQCRSQIGHEIIDVLESHRQPQQ
jgi:hypothetical protein